MAILAVAVCFAASDGIAEYRMVAAAAMGDEIPVPREAAATIQCDARYSWFTKASPMLLECVEIK